MADKDTAYTTAEDIDSQVQQVGIIIMHILCFGQEVGGFGWGAVQF